VFVGKVAFFALSGSDQANPMEERTGSQGMSVGEDRVNPMGASTIEWTDFTWNPTTGCRRVSPGCDHCYAAALAKRLKAMGNRRYQNDGPDGPGFGLTLHADKLQEPLSWRKPRRVFVNSMSDLFHPAIPLWFLAEAFRVMQAASRHQFQILTKRPERMAKVVPRILSLLDSEPLANVWLGTSIESAEYLKRADALRSTPARVRFLSLEPLLGPLFELDLDGIDWVIVGGESGVAHRPIDSSWVRAIRDQCTSAGVAFFFKQWGGLTPGAGGRLLDGRTWDEMPNCGT
jgi:protein gp37